MPAPQLTPLRFEPLLRQHIWGGRRLGTMLGKPIGDAADYAESWEIVDRGTAQSVVAFGPQSGRTLADLMSTDASALLGRHAGPDRFPLLFKFLDAHQKLSVQVHPNDEQAARLQPPDLGKTEAWLVLHADPGSVVYAGLKRGFDRHALERELYRGTAEYCLHQLEPRPGDFLFIPAGTVHALGAGLLIAEIQQSSDTTFRLFDWNRVGADGRPRDLHIDQGLSAIDYGRGPIAIQVPQTTSRPFVERLVACEKFVVDRWHWHGSEVVGGDNCCHILAAVAGEVEVQGDPASLPLRPGETLLLPAIVDRTTLTARQPATLLDIYLP
jgi:mannose-6-phosphate isomerase